MSRRGVASARNGAIACSPAAVSPAQARFAKMTVCPWMASGRKGIAGAGITLAIVERSSLAASAAAMKPATVARWQAGRGSRRRCCQGLEAVQETGHDTEVAASATDPPEEVRVFVVADPKGPSVGGDDVRGDRLSIVIVFPDQVADTAAEGMPPMPTGRVAETDASQGPPPPC
jgi:hypothetical protein